MPTSIRSNTVQTVLANAAIPQQKTVMVGGRPVAITTPFASPQDWRDVSIYFLLLDRFNNPIAPPRHTPFDGQHGVFQGGTFNGVRQQLDYLQELGVGAIWLSPVTKNCQYEDTTYHGYGFQDFLQVEPRFASDPQAAKLHPQLAEDELRALIDAAHARNIYIIFDIVLNHAGNVFGYVVNGNDNAPSADGRNEVYPSDGTMSRATPPSPILPVRRPASPMMPPCGPPNSSATPCFGVKEKGASLVGTLSH